MEFQTGRINRILLRIWPVDRGDAMAVWSRYPVASELQSQADRMVTRVYSSRSFAAAKVALIARFKE